jgi:hypothetical protein
VIPLQRDVEAAALACASQTIRSSYRPGVAVAAVLATEIVATVLSECVVPKGEVAGETAVAGGVIIAGPRGFRVGGG